MAENRRPIDPMSGPGGVRELSARWVVTGDLVLTSAAHLGSGEDGEQVDLPLLRDRAEGRPLLTGSSLAGAMRSYANDLWLGYEVSEERTEDADRIQSLFGGSRGLDEGEQSPLIVFDALGTLPAQQAAAIRDGVALDAKTGTAGEHLKFDVEVLPPGTAFGLRLELLVTNDAQEPAQIQVLAAALAGLEQGEISIGAKRSRGFGACLVREWRARRFGLTSQAGWLAWLLSDHKTPTVGITPANTITAAWDGLVPQPPPDRRNRVCIDLQLRVPGGLLVRSPGLTAASSDAVHLHSGDQPVLPGTSLAGVLRARALRIARVIRAGQGDVTRWVDRLFGPRRLRDMTERVPLHASRLRASEPELRQSRLLRQTRIRIDRFTSGVVDGALFEEEPVFAGATAVRLEVRQPRAGDLGLLLLVLKDLLTGDLPLGGASSVGRGVATGTATIHLPDHAHPLVLDPSQPADAGTVELLNRLVQEFHDAPSLKEAP